jgi:hypothetical protein
MIFRQFAVLLLVALALSLGAGCSTRSEVVKNVDEQKPVLLTIPDNVNWMGKDAQVATCLKQMNAQSEAFAKKNKGNIWWQYRVGGQEEVKDDLRRAGMKDPNLLRTIGAAFVPFRIGTGGGNQNMVMTMMTVRQQAQIRLSGCVAHGKLY